MYIQHCVAKYNGKSGIPDKCQQPKFIERIVLWYEFDSAGKFSHGKLLIKEKDSHTIVMERCRFCCCKIFENIFTNK